MVNDAHYLLAIGTGQILATYVAPFLSEPIVIAGINAVVSVLSVWIYSRFKYRK
jgi:hypothetical protein